jgi:hypothetical protein
MSNIYNRRLDYEVLASGKRVLQRPEKPVIPKYAVVGNTAPNLDFQTNRMLQPLFATKKPIPQSPYTPKQPVNASGLGGRAPIYIDYVVPDRPKPTKPKGLVWEPNSIRELYNNVYPDGLPKNNIGAQAANSQYLDALNQEKKQKQLEQRYNERLRVGRNADDIKEIDEGKRTGRPHPDARMEQELKRLDEMLADTKYGKGPYRNIALSTEGHAKLAQKQAEDIRAELNKLRAAAKSHKDEVVAAIGSSSMGTFRELDLTDEKILGDFLTSYKSTNDNVPLKSDKNAVQTRKALILDYLKSQDPKLDLKDKEVQKQAEALQKEIPFTYKKISSYENKIKEILEKSPPEYTALSPVFIPGGPSKTLPSPGGGLFGWGGKSS